MKFMTTLERDEDGVWVVECPSIPGRVSQGQTREEALANIREAIAACLEVRAERGMPLTIETQQVVFATLVLCWPNWQLGLYSTCESRSFRSGRAIRQWGRRPLID